MADHWLDDAVLYEIYPQSFADSDGDGIGDLRGVIDHLDHLASLGVDAHLVQPVLRVAVRRRRVRRGRLPADRAALRHQRRPGRAGGAGPRARHPGAPRPGRRATPRSSTRGSRPSSRAEGPHPDGDRYIWCLEPPDRGMGAPTCPGRRPGCPRPGPRRGWYLKNFYDAQPALNFGWTQRTRRRAVARRRRRARPAAQPPGARRHHRFLAAPGSRGLPRRHGVLARQGRPGRRRPETSASVWREIRGGSTPTHPDAVLIPEGTEPRTGAPLAFHADFALVIHDAAREPLRQPRRRHAPLARAARAVLRRRGPRQHEHLPESVGRGP